MTFETLYVTGLSWMRRPAFPGCISAGALLVRILRELDPNEARQLRAYDDAARALQEAR